MRGERLKYITAVVLYGTIGMFLRSVNLPSELVAMCRGVLGSCFIVLYMRAKGIQSDKEAIRRNAKLLVLSGIFLGLNWIFLFAAYMQTTVAIASLCNYLAPVIVVAVAPFLLKEKTDPKKMIFVFTAFCGIILVSGVLTGERGSSRGILSGLLAALCFVALVICNRKMTGMPSFDRAVIQLFLSAVTILPYFLIRNRSGMDAPDAKSIAIVLMLGLIHTGFAYCLYFRGMERLPVQTFAILGYLEPVVSVLCSVFFLRESLDAAGWAGAALVLFSAAASEWRTGEG